MMDPFERRGPPYQGPRNVAPDLAALLRREVAQAARVPAGSILSDKPLLSLGLDSLAVVELQYGLEQALGVSISLEEILDGIDLAGLAEIVTAALAEGRGVQEPIVTGADDARELPLSPGQLALWLLQQVAVESGPLHIAAAARVDPAGGPRLDTAVLGRCLTALAERHPILLSTFAEGGDGPVQRAGAGRLPELVEVDATAWSEQELGVWCERQAYRPFALATGPLLRLAVARRSGGADVLVFAIHHLVADFWSVAVLVRDLAALYRGQLLPDLPLTYRDYLRWQAERLAGSAMEPLWTYWREQLSPRPARLALPADRPRPAVRSFRGGAVPLSLGPELSTALARLAERGGATLFTTLLAAFQAFLGRSCGQSDLVVGSPAAGRGRPELAGLAGYFVNLLALRADLSGDPSFLALLGRARGRVLGALEHQELPLSWLAERLLAEGDAAAAPFVEACFVLQRAQAAADAGLAAFAVGARDARLDFGGLTLAPGELAERWSQFDLVLRTAEVNGAVAASLQFNADLFDRATASRLLGHFGALLAGAAANPAQPLSALPLLFMAERHQLSAEWNDTAVAADAGPLIHERVAAQARRNPETLALVDGSRRVSYGDLDRWARRIARALRGFGVGPEVRVGVCLERSAELVAACLGVLHAGGAYVALDPSHPEDRLGFQLRDSQVPVLLTRCGSLSELALGRGVRCLFPRELEREEENEGADLPAPPLLADNLAYVIYTSGSTGRPKGVDLRHGSLLNLVAWQGRLLGVTAGDRTSLLAGVGYDATILEIWVYLAAGASLHIAPDALRTVPAELLGWMTEQGITTSFLPTALAEGLLDLDWEGESAPRSSLRSVLTGGDRLHRGSPVSLPFQLINAYGPTEATVVATAGPVPAQDPAVRRGQAPAIGRPLANAQVHVVDRTRGDLQPVPIGVPGELLVGGAGLARGYLGRPDLTADRFVPDPFAAEPGARLYRTGDLVRWSAAGEIEFLGRLDQQVKIRGQRIELGEIEATLLLHGGLSAAAVDLGGPEGDRHLIAYTVPQGGAAPTAEELRSFLASRLPAYMVPAFFVPLAELPLTTNGKLDRRALPNPAASAPETPYVAPRSAFETVLAGIWAGVLKRDRVGIHDNFFALGGNSLNAAQVVAKIRSSLGMELPLQRLFAAPTIALCSVAIVEELARQAGGETVAMLLSELESP